MNYKTFLIPALLLLVITPVISALDLYIERYFFNHGEGQFISNSVTTFLFEYGTLPGNAAACLFLVALILSFVVKKMQPWRAPAIMFLLSFALGAGLIVHAVLKDHWGRPRPKQLIEFGGIQEFRPYYKPNFNPPEPSKSFSCGHCSMGFCFFALAFIGTRIRNRACIYLGWLLAIGLGVSLSILRMAQGGHFLSDTIMTAWVMWSTALFADWLIYEKLKTLFTKENYVEST